MSKANTIFGNPKIIANEKNIFDPKVYDVMKPGQILAWRTQTYNTLGNNQEFTVEEMSKFMDISVTKTETDVSDLDLSFDIKDLDFDITDFNFVEQAEEHTAHNVYVMLDSSFIAHNDVCNHLSDISEMVNDHFSAVLNRKVQTVFVKNPVSKVETKYKQVGKRFENNPELIEICTKYLNLLDNEDYEILKAGFSCVHDFSMDETNHIFIQLEKQALEKKYEFFNEVVFNHMADGLDEDKIKEIMADLKYRFFSKFRNEVNDDVQLEIAKNLKESSDNCDVVIFTDDRRLSNKFQRNNLGVFGTGNFIKYLKGDSMCDEKYIKFEYKK